MTCKITIKNDGPDPLLVSVMGEPSYIVLPDQQMGKYIPTGKEIVLKEVLMLNEELEKKRVVITKVD